MVQVALTVGSAGPGSVSMQSTGQTAIQTSQPEQLSGLITAFGRPFRGVTAVAMELCGCGFEALTDELAHQLAIRRAGGFTHDVFHDLALVSPNHLNGLFDELLDATADGLVRRPRDEAAADVFCALGSITPAAENSGRDGRRRKARLLVVFLHLSF